MNFQNRISGQGVEKAGQLLANPYNFRLHNELQQKGVKGSLDEIGWIQQVIINKRTGRIIDGHLRVKLALREGEETEVPVIYVELSENEEKLALSLLDPLTEMAGMDKDIYKDLLDELNTTSADLQEVLEEIASKNKILENISPEDFKEYNENIETEFQCPKCGYEWSGKQKT